MAFKSMILMITAIVFLVLPGMMYNNLTASGFQASQTLSCPGNGDVTCQGTVAEGCQVSSNYCTLSGQTVSFLSHTSIFTSLLSGNIFALFSNLNNQGSASLHGPWDLMGGLNVYQGRINCVIDDVPGKGLTKWQVHNCGEANTDTSNKTQANAARWYNWNPNILGTAATQIAIYQLGINGTTPLGCQWAFQINYTSAAKTTGYTWYGCDLAQGLGSVKTDREWSFWFAVPYEHGVLVAADKYASGAGCNGGNCYHENVQFALVNWEAEFCFRTSAGDFSVGNSKYMVSGECNQFWQNLQAQVQTAGGNSQAFGLLSPIILWFLGIVLLFIGLGIGIGWGGSVLGTGTQGGVSENEAGSKLAQTVGLGLIMWIPLYSEFSTWFTSGLLPYGFDGTVGIMALILTGMFWTGIFWRIQSRD